MISKCGRTAPDMPLPRPAHGTLPLMAVAWTWLALGVAAPGSPAQPSQPTPPGAAGIPAAAAGKPASGAAADGRQVKGAPVDDPALPRVLVIGDSISMNYHDAAQAALQGVANVHRIEGNSFSTAFGVTNLARWLGDYRAPGRHWDVIQFNHGLHDLRQDYNKSTGTWGPYAVSLAEYRQNLEKEIALLQQTGATLIWCTTTPVPHSNTGKYARRQEAELEFNRAALEVMRRHPEIRINDLHQFVCATPAFDRWRQGNEVHYWGRDLQAVLGREVAGVIANALRSRKPDAHPHP